MEKPRLLLIEPTKLRPNGMPARIAREGMRTLTLPYLAGMTPPEWDVSVQVDALDAVTGREPADLVGISVLTQRAPRAYQIADHFRRRGVKVVLGGAHVTLNPEEAEGHADTLVLGEAEYVWRQLLDDFSAGRLQPRYCADRLHDLDDLAAPRFDLIRNNRYYTLLRPIQTTRGCPHRCEFCTVSSVYGHTYRHRPVEQVIEDIRAIRATSRYVFFVDDNLAADPKYARELFEALIPLKISWSAQLNLNFADDENLLALAARSGFQMAVCGIENVNSENLASINKAAVNDPKQYRELITRYRRHGVLVLAGMIMGFDTDTEASIAENIEFMTTERLPIISLYLLTPFPGTPLFDRFAQEGRLLTRDWSRYDSYTCVFRPRNLSPERLTQLYWKANREVTTLRTILRRFSPPPLPRRRTFLPDLIATGLVFTNNLVLFRRDARREQPPQV
ncbi:MAG: radical SAM protein [Candidatus Lernaella stagnicola]|nr:radical SAM protein [Candidatus Lernaella stagnicola]